jgi:glycosyltransferase involved in cell wall biosynthesis
MSGTETEVLVLLPALNEAGCVGAVIDEVAATLPGARCLVIDDGSTDDTAEVARAHGAEVAVLPFNLGVGGALRLGLRYAVERGYRIVAQVDADGQHDPASLLPMIDGLAGADVVIGARFTEGDLYQVRGPRRWMMAILARTLSQVAGRTLTDVTSGFRVFGPRAIRLLARELPAEYLGDTVEALVILARAGLTVVQVPTQMRPRAAGEASHNVPRAAVHLARAMFALTLAMSRRPVEVPQ